jgi:D-tyrosyl-tRNA(Tyr) deacylase
MRAVIQRVSEASCIVNNLITGKINQGLMVLLGVHDTDTLEDLIWLAKKIVNMRIFNDEKMQMNLSLLDLNGQILLISQFTLFAQTKKGNRPSFIEAAKPNFAEPMYQNMILEFEKLTQKKVETGIFGADMKIQIINDGPVTITIDSKNKE